MRVLTWPDVLRLAIPQTGSNKLHFICPITHEDPKLGKGKTKRKTRMIFTHDVRKLHADNDGCGTGAWSPVIRYGPSEQLWQGKMWAGDRD
jgi:hypothetical protein